ncbi:MAG: mechanosensitive ion channel [Gemmatimonadota bacterium]|nr:MAG: mechanosensitive ion channel [Gemmatimonadota bacterium]
MQDVFETLTSFATVYVLKVVGAIVILIIGRIAANIGKRIIMKLMRNRNVDEAIVGFVGTLAKTLILVVAVVAALEAFGVKTASFVAILAAAGFAIGFALQGSLSNFAAGVMLLVFRPFKVGDFIDAAGEKGSVRAIRIFTTELASPDNVQIIIPNGQIFGSIIKNYAANDIRRVDLTAGIGYGSDMTKAADILLRILKEDPLVLDEPAPVVAVSELADSSVNFVVRPWCKKENYWTLFFRITQNIKEEFDKAGIEIPFPQRDVHMYKETA